MAQTRLDKIIEGGTINYNKKPNRAFVDALYLEFHNRKATDNEVKHFANMSIQDTSNIIAGRQIIYPPKSKKVEVVKKQIKDNIKRYKNTINIKGNPTDEQRDFVNDISTRYKLKEPIDVTVDMKIPDEFISKVDKGKQTYIQKNNRQISGLYDWQTNNAFVNPNLGNDFKRDYTHELGHAVDDQYGTSKQFPTLFGQTIQEDNTDPLDPNFQLENTANHFRKYAENPEEYKTKYPKEYDYWEKTLKIPDEFLNNK